MSGKRRRHKTRSSASVEGLPFPARDSVHATLNAVPNVEHSRPSHQSPPPQRPLLASLRGRSISALNVNGSALHSSPDSVPLVYASLPPTPISRSASPPFHNPHSLPHAPPFSLWDYLREELLATDFDSHQELKWDRVSNFLSMPLAIEKVIGFGFILCLDSFLYNFTILPIRFVLALGRLIHNALLSPSSYLPASQKADILRVFLIAVTILILVPLTDPSKIYHSIRGQDTIKLYVIFNALEIGDRLCASIGQDVLDCLFSRSTLDPLSRKHPFLASKFRPVLYLALAIFYNVMHTLVMIYQLLSLNVAVNSYDHALLTLLVSNQFVEIKGSVFKKFEKDNLFQITCADIVERFTLSLMLLIVAFRNLIELSGSAFDFTDGLVLPKSFGWFRGNNVLWTIFYPVVTVLVSEAMVDWLKHAFITKFNHIRPSVYERYMDVLCRDLASASAVSHRRARKHTYADQSPLVARRLGFASLPLAVLAILVGSHSIGLMFSLSADLPSTRTHLFPGSNSDVVRHLRWISMGLLFWACFVVIKILIGVNLLSYATNRSAGMESRQVDDSINDFGRNPVGEGKEERAYNKQLRSFLINSKDDATPTAEIGERKSGDHQKRRPELEEITRWTMVKRIW
jgi:hypothetical protein